SLKLKLEKIEQEDELALLDAGDPLIGNSIYMTGTYTGSTSTVDVIDMPFSFTFALDEEFELMSSASDYSGFIIDEGVINSIIVAFRFDQWFAFNNSETNSDQLIDFTDIVPTGSEIILNDTQNGDNVTIREIIKDNIKESADYGEDEDDDGVLESDEDED
uniref:hypothetical protein n=1 Tax=Oceanispirochaeta sp. TaxID=2035350 RepID=UPI00262D96F3